MDETQFMPGSIPTYSAFDPGMASPGAGDWTQVLAQGLSTWGNVRIAEAQAQSHMPAMYPNGVGYGYPGIRPAAGIGGGLMPLLLIGAVLLFVLKD